MKEPTRLLDDPSQSRLLSSVLQAGMDIEPPPGAKDALLHSLELAIAASALATTTPATIASAGKVAALKLSIVKIVGIACLSGVVIGGAAVAAKMMPRHANTPSRLAAAAPVAAQAPGPTNPNAASQADPAPTSAPDTHDTPSEVEHAASAPTTPSMAGQADRVASSHVKRDSAGVTTSTTAVTQEPDDKSSKLADESEAFANARAQMRGGDAAGAVKALDDMQSRFGAGGLSQERSVLYAEALAASGRVTEARSYADAFVASHPSSALAERMRPYATQP